MKKFTKIMSLLLALAMMFSLVACSGNGDEDSTVGNSGNEIVEDTYVSPYADIEDYDELSEAIYNDVLGEYYEYYTAAKEATNVSERQALMAVAEAKLMESALMLPIYSSGGNYAMNRKAPYTSSTVQWGYSEYRYNTALVCEEPIVSEDYVEMKVKWAELKGTGTYLEWAKQYLIDKGYTLKDTYTFNDTVQPEIWDCLASSRSTVGEYCAPTWESLIYYDAENEMQPGLAESWEKTDNGDGTVTYTFNLRQGVKWVDQQGRELAEVTADDFVAGLQHAIDTQGGLGDLVSGIVLNVDKYMSGEITDFSEVGVTAVDSYTLEYTLAYDCSYFLTMLNYSVFCPLNRKYYESKGGKFGAEFDASAEDYTYGTDPSNIAYCGPYLVTNLTADSTMVFSANPSYWNAENTTINTFTVLYHDGSDTTRNINDFLADTIDGVGLNSSTIEIAKSKALPDGYTSTKGATNYYEEYAYVADTTATSYMGFINVNREALANVNDGAAVSTKTEAQVLRSDAALQNVHFRRALCMAVDRGTYNAQSVGEELKNAALRNSYTPGDFVFLAEDVTIDINGTATEFPAGTKYGEIMQAQIDADGVEIVVWNPDANEGLGSGDGYDGWYNPEAAVAELALAIEELEAQGLYISESNPIYIDYPYNASSSPRTNMSQSLKQSVEAVLGGSVVINLVECVDTNTWRYCGYYTDFGYEANYDFYDLSGWGPDFGDPQTYLDTFLPDYAGYMIKCIGIY